MNPRTSIETLEDGLVEEFKELWEEADSLREANLKSAGFGNYVSADFEQVFHSLLEQRGKRLTFLEWGSGLGVVTIMASRLGFEAYGIEIEPVLVELSKEFAESYNSDAQFFVGSFIPDGFELDIEEGDEVFRTVEYTEPAYDEMDMELRDFDLVYAYPWPDEHGFHLSIMRQFGNRGAVLMTYDGREGVEMRSTDCENNNRPLGGSDTRNE